MPSPLLPSPILLLLSLMLEDIRRAALYLDEIGAGQACDAAKARNHASRLWTASQAVERLVIAVEQFVVLERSQRAYTEDRDS